MSTSFDPHVCVIIACRGKVGEMLGEQLHALAAQTFSEPWELLIADNGITDDLAPLLAPLTAEFLTIRIIDATERPGRGYALNRGVREARSSRLITLDSDDVVTPDYLRAMNDALSRHDFVGARLDSATLNPPWLQGRRKPLQSLRLEPLLDHRTVVIGAGMGFTRAAFDTVNGFDEDLQALEDLDLSHRLQVAGIPPVFSPAAVVQYRYRRAYREIFRQERTYARCEASLHRKHRATLAPRRLHRTVVGWFDVAVAAIGVSTRTGRVQLATNLGAVTGRIEGSFRYGVLHL